MNSPMEFTKATRKKSRLRLALTGPSGSGKTYSALQIAFGLGGRVAVIDTEKGSASLYTHLGEFDVLELQPPYSPERFIQAVKAAQEAKYDVLIIDSITHEWSGVGGCLELVDEVARAKFKGNSWSAWNDVTPRHRNFLDSLLSSPMHVIVTARSKTETAQTEENGRKKVVKLGMKAEQREGVEYEFTTVLDIVHDGHFAVATKDRTGLFVDTNPKPITQETGKMLNAWLDSGVEVVEAPKPSAGKSISRAEYDALTFERRAMIDELGRELNEAWSLSGAEATYDLFCQTRDNLPLIEEQAALKCLLPSEMRTAFGKIATARKAIQIATTTTNEEPA